MDILNGLTDFEPKIDKTHVEQRIENSEDRIREACEPVLNWRPPGWTASEPGTVTFDDKMMQNFNVDSRRLPGLERKSSADEAGLKPRGPWTIGADGRVDLIRCSNQDVIGDRAGNFEKPDWQVASLSERRKPRPLGPDVVREMLA